MFSLGFPLGTGGPVPVENVFFWTATPQGNEDQFLASFHLHAAQELDPPLDHRGSTNTGSPECLELAARWLKWCESTA
ncbi:uncharacterized protein BDZ99DRAFT_568374 [Mytilinidion resinicola]|uniref:Uncharacterized protein n=1 Tax=Mytilinidion resinicola TaxID=574789 RepID=A0A6A6YX46_9PEZI|nr:uncharacterized protein BDZ99DRAFT_568374 [Mytilinidion resinicola]KAF2813128.1 hypothetical protein BDZ99DRAFT_568374 [Mytilinidion resinicola]